MEKDSWILWFPVFFGVGISVYFALPTEPQIIYGAIALIISIAAGYFLKNRILLFWISIIISTMIAGFVIANIRTATLEAPVLTKNNTVQKITGQIKEIYSRPHGKRLILKNLEIEHIEKEKTPKLIRININTNYADAKIGDIISTLAVLSPPPQPTIAGGYDFARSVYFNQIGGVGYAIANIDVIKISESYSFQHSISKLRQIIVGRVLQATEKIDGNIATALLVGERGGIDKKTLDNIRIAGIAHILAISGMHLSLVAAIFFFFSRAIFALFPRMALNYNIKKWAAYIAICGSLFYLLISGAPISAQRAFIMTTLILIAIIIDRTGTPMRSIAIAAGIVLIFSPESILTPSFQMSFAAVIALVSCFQWLTPFFKKYHDYGIMRRFLLYVAGLAMSSLIAGTATAPFAIYHFNNFSTYGVFANLIAIPTTSFLIMPSGVVSLLLMPVGLEEYPLAVMSWGIDIITSAAEYIAELPQAVEMLPRLPFVSLSMITLGGLWICLWKERWRICGLIPITIGIIMTFFVVTPNIIIGAEGKLFSLKGDGDDIFISSKKIEKYSSEEWQKRFGWKKIIPIKQLNNEHIKCDSLGCIYKKNNHKTAIVNHPLSLKEDCETVNILINLTYFDKPCDNPDVYISIWDIKENGTYSLYLENDGVVIQNVRKSRGDRPWSWKAR